jgi:hypothetical protein
MGQSATWSEWADERAANYCREHSTSVAPIWLSAQTPRGAARMWLAEQIRRRGTGLVEALARKVWP